ncbi:MAG: MBL fold metallo-hydrolase [Deltaproteobacteria bacterium]|nr:MBL fold metallo-hydrolase [Deltaproteobacteria bacterium]
MKNNYLKEAKRIPTSEAWFEVVKLPNNVYAFFEPGHREQVNSFLITGTEKDILYDTGMGIASIRCALDELMRFENLPAHDVMVVLSHSHLDHIGGSAEFEKVYLLNNGYGKNKLKAGIRKGVFSDYMAELTPPPDPPEGYDPKEFFIPPLPGEKIDVIGDGEVIDLGNRQFRVIRTLGHTEDSVCLYDADNRLIFTGDSVHPEWNLVRDPVLYEKDLEKLEALPRRFHYNTHGNQLVDTDCLNKVLGAVKKVNAGEVGHSIIEAYGFSMRQYEVDGINFYICPELLTAI